MDFFMNPHLHTILTIAGSDPMGGAGIQADIRVGCQMGFHVLTALTAVTSQNSKGCIDLGLVNNQSLDYQLKSIVEDVVPDAVKIGMVGSIENIKVIAHFLDSLPSITPVVIDPILKFTTGGIGNFGQKEYLEILKEELFPFSTVITPNLEELSIISPDKGISQIIPEDINVKALIIKGGHNQKEVVEDVLILPHERYFSTGQRVKCKNLHGTGCVYSTLLACYLALKIPLKEAFLKTSETIRQIIDKSCNYSLGVSSYGPLNINNYQI